MAARCSTRPVCFFIFGMRRGSPGLPDGVRFVPGGCDKSPPSVRRLRHGGVPERSPGIWEQGITEPLAPRSHLDSASDSRLPTSMIVLAVSVFGRRSSGAKPGCWLSPLALQLSSFPACRCGVGGAAPETKTLRTSTQLLPYPPCLLVLRVGVFFPFLCSARTARRAKLWISDVMPANPAKAMYGLDARYAPDQQCPSIRPAARSRLLGCGPGAPNYQGIRY